jgi:hypothetical protein
MGFLMSTAVLIMAEKNLRGFQNALFAWHSVKGVEDVLFTVSIAQSDVQQHMIEEAVEFFHHRGLDNTMIFLEPAGATYEERRDSSLQALWNIGTQTVWEAAEDEVVSEDVLAG